jgi:hypothetical protein
MNISPEKPAVAPAPLAYDEITSLPVTDRGPWVATSRGGMWSIEHPHPDDVYIDDIAWGIARTCRYGGQIKPEFEMYSVAEHCSTMTWWAIDNDKVEYLEDALAILLHDSSEAIFGDIATPIKAMLPKYRELEDACQAVMTHSFGLTPENTLITKLELKDIDKRIRVDERTQIIGEPAKSAGLNLTWEKEPDLKPIGVEMLCLLPSQARANFLSCFVWCCENLPLRDPSIAHRIHRQIDGMVDEIPGVRPVLREMTLNPFEDEETQHADAEGPSV